MKGGRVKASRVLCASIVAACAFVLPGAVRSQDVADVQTYRQQLEADVRAGNLFLWQRVGVEPCTGIPVENQLNRHDLPIPLTAKRKLVDAVRAGSVKDITIPRGAEFNYASYRNGWRGRTMTDWVDREFVDAEEYRVVDGGTEYVLCVASDCNNALVRINSLPEKEHTMTRVRTKRALAAAVPETAPAATKEIPEPEVSREWAQNGTMWIHAERVEQTESKQFQNNGFSGLEWVVRPRSYYGLLKEYDLAFVLRLSPNMLNRNFTANTRLGARAMVLALPKMPLFVLTEAGWWLDATQLTRRVVTRVEADRVFWEERRKMFNGNGPYGRVLVVGPLLSYVEGTYRTGTNLDQELSAVVTLEPGPVYARVEQSDQRNKERSGTDDAFPLTFPADRMRIRGAYLGPKFSDHFVLYGSWNDWEYSNAQWVGRFWGPGAGAEWRLNRRFRVVGDFKYFTHAVEQDRIYGTRYSDKPWRVKTGINLSW